MEDKYYVKIIKIISVLILLLLSASVGADFADNNWKKDINKVSNSGINLMFDDSGYVYQINKIDIINNTNFTDEWNNHYKNRLLDNRINKTIYK